ncbi:GAF domain-containing protein [Glaciecola sp. MH2013]|uniref:GAF domain-containing protein n=1 Tax=Glaciecola sp. MH2013 TaxID=2785524 RepID=UPI0018A05D5A|nr:GAF domain-containing protein [Glaciecola sp. MH2013]MBF7072784.1 GAF domain-containing protein [Glaciecola sp. MH2013]
MTDEQRDKQYKEMHAQIVALITGETDVIANMANISAVLFNGLKDINWAGFYLFKEDQLVLGPFQGQPACIRIPMGKGVCGSAALEERTFVVDNVHEFDGHIACDAASNSEIVVPVFSAEHKLLGVLDVDSPLYERFTNSDKIGLEAIAKALTATLQ